MKKNINAPVTPRLTWIMLRAISRTSCQLCRIHIGKTNTGHAKITSGTFSGEQKMILELIKHYIQQLTAVELLLLKDFINIRLKGGDVGKDNDDQKAG